MLEREREGEDGKGWGGEQLLAVCNSAVKCLLPQQKSYHGRQCQLYGGGRALCTAPSPPAIAAASLLCVSAADADVLPPKLMSSLPNAALPASAVTKPWSRSPALAATLARVPLGG